MNLEREISARVEHSRILSDSLNYLDNILLDESLSSNFNLKAKLNYLYGYLNGAKLFNEKLLEKLKGQPK